MTVVRIKQDPGNGLWQLVDEQDIPLLARVMNVPAQSDGDIAFFPFRQAAVDTAMGLGYDIDFAASDPAVPLDEPIEVSPQDPSVTGAGDMGSFAEPAFPPPAPDRPLDDPEWVAPFLDAARTGAVETDGDMLARLNTDGQEWAREFCKRFSTPLAILDEQLMLGWFANAIEAGRSAGYEAGMIEARALVIEVEGLRTRMAAIRATVGE
jgi:hypothetical protein